MVKKISSTEICRWCGEKFEHITCKNGIDTDDDEAGVYCNKHIKVENIQAWLCSISVASLLIIVLATCTLNLVIPTHICIEWFFWIIIPTIILSEFLYLHNKINIRGFWNNALDKLQNVVVAAGMLFSPVTLIFFVWTRGDKLIDLFGSIYQLIFDLKEPIGLLVIGIIAFVLYIWINKRIKDTLNKR